jgi:hypothetical protein
MTTTRDYMLPAATTLPETVQFLMGWRHHLSTHHDQLTHAVLPGSYTAQCGVVISVVGGPWPEPGAGTPLSRCAICAQAVQGLSRDAGTRPDAR